MTTSLVAMALLLVTACVPIAPWRKAQSAGQSGFSGTGILDAALRWETIYPGWIDRELSQLKAAGFDFLIEQDPFDFGPDKVLALADKAQRYGLKIMWGTGSPASKLAANLGAVWPQWGRSTDQVLDAIVYVLARHPATMGWFVADEPPASLQGEMCRRAQRLRDASNRAGRPGLKIMAVHYSHTDTPYEWTSNAATYKSSLDSVLPMVDRCFAIDIAAMDNYPVAEARTDSRGTITAWHWGKHPSTTGGMAGMLEAATAQRGLQSAMFVEAWTRQAALFDSTPTAAWPGSYRGVNFLAQQARAARAAGVDMVVAWVYAGVWTAPNAAAKWQDVHAAFAGL